MRNLLVVAVASLLLPACSAGGGGRGAAGGVHSFMGQTPPEVPAGITTLRGEPYTLASQRGRVLYVQFSFPQCPACHDVLPHVVRWEQALRDQGFSAVYVADGRRDSAPNVSSSLASEGVSFPVLYDAGGTMTQTWRVTAFPTAYVLGRDGRVVWEGVPSYDPAGVERAVRAAVAAR